MVVLDQEGTAYGQNLHRALEELCADNFHAGSFVPFGLLAPLWSRACKIRSLARHAP